jgi:hypothetical protein
VNGECALGSKYATSKMEAYQAVGPQASASMFSLRDETADDAERFFNDAQYTVPRSTMEKFEVDESDVTFTFANSDNLAGADDNGVLDRALRYSDVRRYTSLFAVDVHDVAGRAFRACVPVRGLLEPPAPPPSLPRPDVESDDEGGTLEDGGDDNAGPSNAENGETKRASLVAQQVEYMRNFNDNPDLVRC